MKKIRQDNHIDKAELKAEAIQTLNMYYTMQKLYRERNHTLIENWQ